MISLFQPFLFLIARSTPDELQKQVEFLRAENEMLRKRVPKKRIFLKADERAQLLTLGREIGPGVRSIITIVDYSTFRRWLRREDGTPPRARKGRPRIAEILRKLVVQIANETGWGYSRILGELRKLNLGKICRQSVKNTWWSANWSLEHFDHIVSEYVAYYLQCRLHHRIGNRLIGEAPPETHVELKSLDEIRCERRLGGLLKHYSRAA